MSEKRLYARTQPQQVYTVMNKGHTGVEQVSTHGCLSSSRILSPHLLQTTSIYTCELGRLAM